MGASRKDADPNRMVQVSTGVYRRDTRAGPRFIVRVWNPSKGQAGGWDWESLPDGATKTQAVKRRRELQVQKDNGRRRRGDVTVAEWAGRYEDGEWVPGRWLELMPRKAESTNIHNDARVRPFAKAFASRALGAVSEEEAAGFALEHPSSLKEVHAMYNDACSKRLVDRNPFAGIRSRSQEGRRNIVVLTDGELEQLCAIARAVHQGYGERFAAMIQTAAWTGLRPGELFLLALEPHDQLNFADLRAGTIHVDWQLGGKTGKVGRPKKESMREVVLLPGAEDALRSIGEWEPGEPVFRTKGGRRFNQRTFFYYWHPVRSAFVSALPPGHHLRTRGDNLDFYELRHFFGTKLAHPPAGVKPASPYEIAAMMGHADGGQLAMERYVHVRSQEAQRSVRDAWRKAV